jgi:hypothetical protein
MARSSSSSEKTSSKAPRKASENDRSVKAGFKVTITSDLTDEQRKALLANNKKQRRKIEQELCNKMDDIQTTCDKNGVLLGSFNDEALQHLEELGKAYHAQLQRLDSLERTCSTFADKLDAITRKLNLRDRPPTPFVISPALTPPPSDSLEAVFSPARIEIDD